ncbi:MAG: TolC family protein [Silvibacterium sp.]
MLLPLLRAATAFSVILLNVPGILAQTTVSAAASAAPEPLVITLQDAITRAETNDPGYATSAADRGVAHLDRSIGRSALLPVITYHNQYLYTQPNGLKNQAGQGASAQDAPRFIANNAIREYASQALVTETLSAANFADLKHADAAAAKAEADLEVARRALVVTVAAAYYTLVAEESSVRVAQRAEDEARSFVELTEKLEKGREVAHADVVEANLQLQQRQRDLADAQLAAEKARLELGVLVLSDPRVPYRLADSDLVTPALPSRDDSEAAAAKNNPELKSALAALRMSREAVSAAWAAYLPTLSLNYTYGIDAPQFAVNGPAGVRNLGYSTFATLDIPVWDWMATHDRVKQSELRQKVAQTQLTATQKKLIADMEEYYSEAKVANDELASLTLSAQTAEDSLRLTKLRYSAGEATALEVVDAENAATQAESASADGTVRYRVALANLQTLTGTL